MLRTTTITTRSIDWVNNQSTGGFRIHWKLYLKMLDALSDLAWLRKKVMTAMQVENANSFAVRWELFKVYLHLYTWAFIWNVLLKPFGQFYSTSTRIQGTYRVNGKSLQNISLTKKVKHKLFIFTLTRSSQLTEAEIAELIK